jgi:hypothetical protein
MCNKFKILLLLLVLCSYSYNAFNVFNQFKTKSLLLSSSKKSYKIERYVAMSTIDIQNDVSLSSSKGKYLLNIYLYYEFYHFIFIFQLSYVIYY